jgi:hypothetical protein
MGSVSWLAMKTHSDRDGEGRTIRPPEPGSRCRVWVWGAVEAVPAANTVFMFTSPVAIPIGGTATLTLQATAAATMPSGAALTQSRNDGGGSWTRSTLPLSAALIAAFMLVAVALAGRPAALAPAATRQHAC